MTHLELENLASEYLEGALEPALKAQFESHLAECSACRTLVEDVRRAVGLCHAAPELEPAPWLVSKILLATVGARKPTLAEQFAAFFRPALQPRFAYAVAMTVFSFSIIVNATGLNLRNLRAEDLNPRTWAFRANRAGHLLYARVEKYYYDLKVVYEIESRLRQLRAQPQAPGKETPPQQTPPSGSTDRQLPAGPQLASAQGLVLAVSVPAGRVPTTTEGNAGRSQSQ